MKGPEPKRGDRKVGTAPTPLARQAASGVPVPGPTQGRWVGAQGSGGSQLGLTPPPALGAQLLHLRRVRRAGRVPAVVAAQQHLSVGKRLGHVASPRQARPATAAPVSTAAAVSAAVLTGLTRSVGARRGHPLHLGRVSGGSLDTAALRWESGAGVPGSRGDGNRLTEGGPLTGSPRPCPGGGVQGWYTPRRAHLDRTPVHCVRPRQASDPDRRLTALIRFRVPCRLENGCRTSPGRRSSSTDPTIPNDTDVGH